MIQATSNRPDIKIVEAVAGNPNIASFDIRSGVVISTFDTFVPAVFSGVAGLIAGLTAGQLLFDKPESIALGGLMGWASYNGFYFLDRFLSTPRYHADYWDGMEEEPEQDFVQTGEGGGHLRLLSRDDKKLLIKFARHYPSIDTLAINPWENGPMTRSDIRYLRDKLLPNLKAVKREGRRVSLNDYGERMIHEWAAGKFDTPPPSDGRISPVQV